MLSLLLLFILCVTCLIVTVLTCDTNLEPLQLWSSKWISVGRVAGLVAAIAAVLPSLSQMHPPVWNWALACHYGAPFLHPTCGLNTLIHHSALAWAPCWHPTLSKASVFMNTVIIQTLTSPFWENHRTELCFSNKSDCTILGKGLLVGIRDLRLILAACPKSLIQGTFCLSREKLLSESLWEICTSNSYPHKQETCWQFVL